MKLGILIPLKSKKVANDWKNTCENLENTVESLAQQTSKNFSAIIIGHEEPEFLQSKGLSSIIEFVKLTEIEPPKLSSNKAANQLLYEKDRCTKIVKGIDTLKKRDMGITHWFPLDADDLLHREFIAYLSAIDDSTSVIIEKGFIFDAERNSLYAQNNFSAYCGSSAILPDALVENFESIDNNTYKNCIFTKINHVDMHSALLNFGLIVYVPQRRLIAYCRNNGENISDYTRPNSFFLTIKRLVRRIITKVYYDARLKSDFSIY